MKDHQSHAYSSPEPRPDWDSSQRQLSWIKATRLFCTPAIDSVSRSPECRIALSESCTGDLADIDQMREVAEAADTYGRFDAVIHNAGDIDGPDVAEVNVIAPYVLTAFMEQPGRIVVVSSSLHRAGSTHGMEAGVAGEREVGYNDSKLWVTAFVMEVAERWPSTMVHCLCPGWVPTRMGGPHASDDLTEGHRTQEWLATAPESEIHPRTGAYWHHMAVDRPNPAALDPEFRARLFDALERRTGIEFPLGA